MLNYNMVTNYGVYEDNGALIEIGNKEISKRNKIRAKYYKAIRDREKLENLYNLRLYELFEKCLKEEGKNYENY